MTTPFPRGRFQSRLLYAVLASGLGAFIASWVEPTWRGLVHGERYDRPKSKAIGKGVAPMPSPIWAGTGAAVGLALGLVGRRWQVRGRLLAAVLGAGVGTVAGGAFAAASPAVHTPATRAAPNRGPYWDLYTRQVMTEGIVLGGWIGAVTGLLVGWTGRTSRSGPTEAPSPVRQPTRSYALAIDLDVERLRADSADPNSTADLGVRRVLQQHGFDRHQGAVHYGGESVTAVTCVLAAQDLARTLPWFAASVREVRMLRVGESDDLMPAVQRAVGGQP